MKKIFISILIVCSSNSMAQDFDLSLFGIYPVIEFDTCRIKRLFKRSAFYKDIHQSIYTYERELSYGTKDAHDYYLSFKTKRLSKKTELKVNRELEKLNRYEIRLNDSLKLFKRIVFDYDEKIRIEDSIMRAKKKEAANMIRVHDSIVSIKCKEFIDPTYISQTIGIGVTSSLQSNIESRLEVNIAAHRGGIDFYDIGDVRVGLRFGGQSRVCIEITFRMFGEEGAEYERLLIASGYKLQSQKKTSNLELEGNYRAQTLNGEQRVYRKDDVVCDVMDGSYLGFSFYRTR